MMIRLLIYLFIFIAPLFSSEKVSIQLKWHHQFQFAGYYAALEKGFYREEGLDVVLKDRDPAKNNIDQILNGESEYGIADSVLLIYQAQKKPIVIVAPIFQHSPNVLITLKSSGIDSPYKLVGKKIAFYPNDADGIATLAMLRETGVLQKGIVRVNTQYDINALLHRDLDAHHAYITNEPYMLLKKGIDINVINPEHFGVDLYGDMLFTTQTEQHKHPERVAAMKRATLRGWKYALEHKEEMIHLIQTKYASDKTAEHLRYEAQGIESVIEPATIPIGTLDYGRMEFVQQLLYRHGLIQSTIPMDQYIYRDAHKQSLALTEEERHWLRSHPIINIAVDAHRAPLESIDSNGIYRGISADYLALISQKLGVQFIPYRNESWSNTLKLMEQHKLDMFSCAGKTPQRESYTIFTPPYLNFRMVIVTEEDVNYLNGANDLKGKTVAVIRGHFAQEVLKNHYPHIKQIEVDTIAQGLEAVSNKKAYAFIDNTASITEAIKLQGYTNLKISGEIPHQYELAMGVRNDWPLFAGIMEKALASITPNERDEIYNRHIKVEYSQPLTWEWVLKIIFPLAVIVAILLYYTRKLRHINRVYKMTMERLEQTQNDLETTNAKLQMLSSTDALTGIANRYLLDETLNQAIESAKRYGRSLAIIMIDLDYFKVVNDTYGHHAGDEVLKTSAALLRQNCRKSDTVGRWGGEEFLIICPEASESEAVTLAEKLRSIFLSSSFVHNHIQTASFGVSAYREENTAETFVIRADEALYAAKESGRNCVRTN